jgi:hypothetical protein
MQAALTQPYTIAIPQQHFDTITWRVAKYKGRPGAGLLPQGMLNQCRQTINAATEVDRCYA